MRDSFFGSLTMLGLELCLRIPLPGSSGLLWDLLWDETFSCELCLLIFFASDAFFSTCCSKQFSLDSPVANFLLFGELLIELASCAYLALRRLIFVLRASAIFFVFPRFKVLMWEWSTFFGFRLWTFQCVLSLSCQFLHEEQNSFIHLATSLALER